MAYPIKVGYDQLRLADAIGIGEPFVGTYQPLSGPLRTFVFATDGTATPASLAMMMSEDAGQTWNEQDSSNRPIIYGYGTAGLPAKLPFSPIADPFTAKLIHVFFLSDGGSGKRLATIATFDADLKQWGSLITGGPDLSFNGYEGAPAVLSMRAANDFVISFDVTSDPVTGNGATLYFRYNGNWSGPFSVITDPLDPNSYNMANTPVLGTGGRLHFIEQVADGTDGSTSFRVRTFFAVGGIGDNWHTIWSVPAPSSDAFGTFSFSSGVTTAAGEVVISYVRYAPGLFSGGNVTSTVHVIRGMSADDPTWTDQIVASVPDDGSKQAIVKCFGRYGVDTSAIPVVDGNGTLRVIWVQESSGKFYTSAYDSGSATWGTATQIFTAADVPLQFVGGPNDNGLDDVAARSIPGGYAIAYGNGPFTDFPDTHSLLRPWYWQSGPGAGNLNTPRGIVQPGIPSSGSGNMYL